MVDPAANAAPRCLDDGYMVAADLPLPEDPRVYRADDSTRVGCNRIYCSDCHHFVRNHPGFGLVTAHPGRAAIESLYDTDDPGASPHLHTRWGRSSHRVYVCRCKVYDCAGARDLRYHSPDNWACAGHLQDEAAATA